MLSTNITGGFLKHYIFRDVQFRVSEASLKRKEK
jgi:hypothetical protein